MKSARGEKNLSLADFLQLERYSTEKLAKAKKKFVECMVFDSGDYEGEVVYLTDKLVVR